MTENEFKKLTSILHDYYFHMLANSNTSEWSTNAGASAHLLQLRALSVSLCVSTCVGIWSMG